MTEPCGARMGDTSIECVLDRGHAGRHWSKAGSNWEASRPPPQAAPDARALAALADEWEQSAENLPKVGPGAEQIFNGDISTYRKCAEMLRALLPTAPPAETAELVALKACVAFVVEYLSDDDHDFAERDSWCDMCKALDQAGHNVFELADRSRAEREAVGGGK